MIPDTIKPLLDRVLIERLDEQELTTASGLVLAVKADQSTIQAKVLATGQGKLLTNGIIVPLSVKPGDTVLVHSQIQWLDDKLTIINEENILGILHEA